MTIKVIGSEDITNLITLLLEGFIEDLEEKKYLKEEGLQYSKDLSKKICTNEYISEVVKAYVGIRPLHMDKN